MAVIRVCDRCQATDRQGPVSRAADASLLRTIVNVNPSLPCSDGQTASPLGVTVSVMLDRELCPTCTAITVLTYMLERCQATPEQLAALTSEGLAGLRATALTALTAEVTQ